MDNRATGGVGVGISKDGILQKYGIGHHKVEIKHPITKYVYEGTKVPYWREIVDLVIRAHKALPEIPTIGWDVAILPNGPVLIEGNDNWEITGPQDTAGGLKKRWYELHK
ncbi:sugar-transfer associated ATP-grasp domain-containing protein [Ruminococcus sp.]|uniref:sugar-transfer associated ATP-grasp domain-containing protein n=1 Tax=Ruminococcus sp. TaxID=41978 RepID=UPI0025F38AC4|nr:sugar-transfer associated ATP-grasp domain-containing protein [Ruminococcus sp.]